MIDESRYLYGYGVSGRANLPERDRAKEGTRFCCRDVSIESHSSSPRLPNSYSRTDLCQVGGLIINAVARGTGIIQTNAAWRIPFGLFYIIPVVVACCVWFVPEVSLQRQFAGNAVVTVQLTIASHLVGWL